MGAEEKRGGRVVRLQAEAVKRIRAVDISPTGSTVIIRGKNGAGKSSLLDSIQYALGGKDVQPPRVIRDGETAAKVVLELEDLIVERRWQSNDRSTLEVRSKEGAKYSSPQAMLDRLTGDLSFDPLAFARVKPDEQARTLARLVGIDLVEHEARRLALFDQRTTVNRDAKQLQARLDAAPKPAGPVEPVDPAKLVDEMGGLMERDRERSAAQRALEAARSTATVAEREIGVREKRVLELRQALVEAEQEVVDARGRLGSASSRVGEAELRLDGIADPAPDMQRVRQQLADAEKTNAAARQAAEHDRLATELAGAKQRSEALTQQLQKLDDDRASQMEAAKLPVEGLAISDVGLVLNGIPLEQCSTSEQLKVSVAIGIAMNPSIRLLLVRDGSLLDEDSMAALAAMAESSGIQCWVEQVGGDGVGIVIEDGSVKSVTPADEPAQGELLR